MLELSQVDAYYGNSRTLNNINLRADSGGFLSVLGRNGVGKTTLMRAILGLMDRTTGSIRLDGVELSGRPTHARAKGGIGYVPQGRGILPRFTVQENLRLGTFARANGGTANASDTDRRSGNGNGHGGADERILALFPILKDHLNRAAGNLSGGQQQQLAIARALLSEPKVLLLDEPTEGIQPNIVELIEDVIVRLNRDDGLTVVLVEQNVAFARRASQHFVLMDRGTVAAEGSVSELTDELVHRFMAV